MFEGLSQQEKRLVITIFSASGIAILLMCLAGIYQKNKFSQGKVIVVQEEIVIEYIGEKDE